MKIRTRKFVGVFAGAVYLVVYSLIAMAVGGALFMDTHSMVQLAYFVIAGTLWLPGMMVIIRWMSRSDEAT